MNMLPKRFSLIRSASRSLLMAVIAAPALQAQTPAKEEVVELPAFTVSSEPADRYRAADSISAVRVRAPLLETASSISVMTRELINDVQPGRIFDATRYIAGVQEGRGITFNDRQIIRGFESDGRTVDNFLDSTGVNFEEALIDRIEVSKGPNAILAPGGVPGGAINVVTKSPRFVKERSLTALVGLYDSQKVTLDMTDKVNNSDKMAYRFVGAFQDASRYWSSDAKIQRTLLAPMFTWRLGNNTELTVKYFYLKSWVFRDPIWILDPSVGPDSDPILAPGFKAKSLNGIDPWSGLSFKQHSGQFQLSTAISDHLSTRVAGRATFTLEDTEQEIISTASLANRYNPATGVLTQDYIWSVTNGVPSSTFSPYVDPTSIPVRGEKVHAINQQAAIQNDWVARFSVHGASLQTVAGVAAQTFYGTDRRWNGTLPAINLLSPRSVVYATWSTAYSRNAANQVYNWQAYVNQRVGLFTDRLILNGGLLRYGTETYAVDRLTGAAGSRLKGAKNMYLASALVKIRPNASLYYSRSTNATPTIVNNAPLWRDGNQDEIGAKLELMGGKLAMNAAYFEISQTNVSVPNPERVVDPTAPASLLSDLSDKGMEFELSGALTPNLSAFASYTHLKLRDSLNRPIRAVADNLVSLMMNYKFKGTLKGFNVNAGAVYSSKKPGDTTSGNFTALNVVTKQSFFIPAYTTYNMGASYGWDQYLVRLYVDNLTNKKDFVNVAGSRVAFYTAPGINVRLSATLKF